jgi:transcriptional regulator with XRE-family HTH domain
MAGRPKFEITEKITIKAEKFAKQGLTLEQIAHNLGISYDTLNERRKENPEFSEAIERGKSKGIEVITNALFEKAESGDVSAIKYFLNNRDNNNWKDKIESVVTNKYEYDPESDERRLQTLIDLARKREESGITKH